MATVSHTIYSRYDPQESGTTEREPDELGSNDAWESAACLKLQRQPHFVPAALPFDDWSSGLNKSPRKCIYENSSVGKDLSEWYRSLRSEQHINPQEKTKACTEPVPRKGSSPNTILERGDKNNWFILEALKSEQGQSFSLPPPSLADIIARGPPPLPTEGRYNPPVWLEIGPSNKGFKMLQRSGWNEGEALGPDVVRRPPDITSNEVIPLAAGKKGKIKMDNIKQEVLELKVKGYDGVNELRNVDVIDLTLSDTDPDNNEDNDTRHGFGGFSGSRSRVGEIYPHAESSNEPSNHNRTALLTPIATVLKSDRLGIGLKAKTIGPYKASQKRITHGAAALEAHIKSAKEMQERKKVLGRGRRGFAKLRKREESERKRMLAYLND